jgi:hypothetical protein
MNRMRNIGAAVILSAAVATPVLARAPSKQHAVLAPQTNYYKQDQQRAPSMLRSDNDEHRDIENRGDRPWGGGPG